MNIHFYASDAKDNSIIAYGDTHQKNRHFKITYKKGQYWPFRLVCGKYAALPVGKSLDEAKHICSNCVRPTT